MQVMYLDDTPMIRIETSERRDLVTLALSGRIQAEDLPELKRVMESYSKPVVLDPPGVKVVDERQSHSSRILKLITERSPIVRRT
jgi:hydroxyethylthiazole kinase-like sugar kinase family protein